MGVLVKVDKTALFDKGIQLFHTLVIMVMTFGFFFLQGFELALGLAILACDLAYLAFLAFFHSCEFLLSSLEAR